MMLTRRDYMEGCCTHRQFYAAVCETAGIRFGEGGELVERARTALAAGDEYLNTIPLSVWERMAEANAPRLNTALRAHGDSYSLGGGVCIYKEAVRQAAERAHACEACARGHAGDCPWGEIEGPDVNNEAPECGCGEPSCLGITCYGGNQ